MHFIGDQCDDMMGWGPGEIQSKRIIRVGKLGCLAMRTEQMEKSRQIFASPPTYCGYAHCLYIGPGSRHSSNLTRARTHTRPHREIRLGHDSELAEADAEVLMTKISSSFGFGGPWLQEQAGDGRAWRTAQGA